MSEKDACKRPQQLLNYPRVPPPFPPPSCPRCSSGNTKFCYYNNYSVLQPRYLCKNCRRYWTHGGVLRTVPIGGTSRKRDRVDSASSSSPFSISPIKTHSTEYIHGKFRPPVTHTNMQSYRGVNTLFDAVNVSFGGGSRPLAAPSINYGHQEFGLRYFQQPQFQPSPPQQPVLTGQNVALTSNSITLTSPNNLHVSIARDPGAAANVVNIDEWCDPLQSYKPPSP